LGLCASLVRHKVIDRDFNCLRACQQLFKIYNALVEIESVRVIEVIIASILVIFC